MLRVGRRLEQTAQARLSARRNHGHLPAPPNRSAVHERYPRFQTRIMQRELGGRVIRSIDHDGVTEGRRGQGTFVSDNQPAAAPSDYSALRSALLKWIERARRSGLDDESINALVLATLSAAFFEEAA